MNHKKIVDDLHRARKSGALDGPPRLSENEVANFCRRLAKSTAIDADNLMMFAEDILANEGNNDRALMLLDGMRAGIQQAREASGGALPDEWKVWKGKGPTPAKWWATNPQTGERVLVYRDYEAYCMD